MNIKVGQKVFVTSVYNRNTFKEDPIVTKVGKKYFQLEGYHNIQFSLETGKDNAGQYSSQYQVYESKETYEHLQLKINVANYLSKLITSSLTYETLVEIKNLIENDNGTK